MENVPVHKPVTFVYVYHKTMKQDKVEAALILKLKRSANTPKGMFSMFKRGVPRSINAVRTRRCDESLVAYGHAEAVYTDDPKVKELYEAIKVPVHPITKKGK